jgi:periplasmic protein TonB
MVQPIWQVLSELGIEGEYCGSAVDAVEKVTTQLFQIVITDWDDQPEAAFLLKTARDQKPTQRPLTLAIVSDEARLPEALRAGANSVLLKPIGADQARDTLSTACELLRSKLASTPQPVTPAKNFPEEPERAASAAAASIVASTALAAVSHTPEKTFRAGEFLQGNSAPGAQFVTECAVQRSLERSEETEVDALTELEPMASAVATQPVAEPKPAVDARNGWAALQSRLMKPPQVAPEAPTKSALLSYEQTPAYEVQPAPFSVSANPGKQSPQSESDTEAALFSYMEGESKESAPAAEARPKRGNVLFPLAFTVACLVLIALPRTRQGLVIMYRSSVRAGEKWLNPPPQPIATVTQHESFGQEGDEYKLPAPANIPDATTDPSQIRVLPFVDPTAKPVKNPDQTAGQTVAANASTDQNQAAADGSQTPAAQIQGHDGVAPVASAPVEPAGTSSAVPPPQETISPPAPLAERQPVSISAPQRNSAPAHELAAPGNIPSSLRSQTASMTPEVSGAKPVEAAMSSIEPVKLPESTLWDLLAQPIEAAYPESAKASGQRGSVVLQVLIGRDGVVQDAKFMQGSLVFARSAIDALKQCHFKPYLMNGRPVSVQSTITLNFKPAS